MRFIQKSFFNTRLNVGPGFDVFPEQRIIEAHLGLRCNAAYLDNVAQVTPSLSSPLRTILITSSDVLSDLVPRVETTIGFLNQLTVSEEVIRTWDARANRRQASWEDFESTFASLQLTSVYRVAAESYKQRLVEIREMTPGTTRSRLSSLLGTESSTYRLIP